MQALGNEGAFAGLGVELGEDAREGELEGMSKLTLDIATYAEETAASAEQMSATTQQTNASTPEIVASVDLLSNHSERLSRLTEQLDLAR